MEPTSTENKSQVLYDRLKEVEEFENTKLGVKGLVDLGITQIPRIFHHAPDSTSYQFQKPKPEHDPIPVIDLSGSVPYLVDRVREASIKYGFFQVINHGVPVGLMDNLVKAIKAFHELPNEEKRQYYGRDTVNKGSGVGFYSNFDLHQSKAASWGDTLAVRLGPDPINPAAIPRVCREEVIEWKKEVNQLAERVIGLLSRGLGLDEERLKGMEYLGRRVMVGHYYPYCPEPHKTVGIGSHTDPGLLTVLVQDHVGGLQVKYDDNWIDLKPVHGALVINIGDLFQMISNDEYKSGEHRVVANSVHEPRVSVATFLSPGMYDKLYGPLQELVSAEKPAMYQHFKFSNFVNMFLTKELDGKSMTNYFKAAND